MSEFSWSPKQQKQAIGDRFFEGDLSPDTDNFIPCDHTSALWFLPIMLGVYVLPLPILVIGFGVTIIRNPANLGQFYQRFVSTDWQGQMLGAILLLFISALSIGLFIQGLSTLRSAIFGVREYQRERKTGQYRYGLLLTKHYLALRTMEPPYQHDPLILGRREIDQFRMEYERVEGHNFRYIVMVRRQSDGSTYAMRFPCGIDCPKPTLYSKLKAWL